MNVANDPICGMMVDEATVLRAKRDGQTFYFRGERCRHTFLGQIEPTSRVAETTGHDDHSRLGNGGHACCAPKSPVHEHKYTSHQEHNRGAVKSSATAKYFCPMCPGVESDQPGDYPKSGVALEMNLAWHGDHAAHEAIK